MRLLVTRGSETLPVEVEDAGPPPGRLRVRLGDAETWSLVDAVTPPGGPFTLLLDGVIHLVDMDEVGGEYAVTTGGAAFRLRVGDPGRRVAQPGAGSGARPAGERVVAPMPGRVVAVHVRAGDRVEPGTPLVVLEAMKMENEFRAGAAGVVREVAAAPGQTVSAGDLLVAIEPPPPAGPAPGDAGVRSLDQGRTPD